MIIQLYICKILVNFQFYIDYTIQYSSLNYLDRVFKIHLTHLSLRIQNISFLKRFYSSLQPLPPHRVYKIRAGKLFLIIFCALGHQS